MEAITLGFALGVGAALVFKRSRAELKAAVGWSARQAGSVTSRVTAAIEDARGRVRREYQRGREESLEQMTEVPPPSVKPADEVVASKSVPPAAVVVVAGSAGPRKNGGVSRQAS